jgi:hypothetical protein
MRRHELQPSNIRRQIFLLLAPDREKQPQLPYLVLTISNLTVVSTYSSREGYLVLYRTVITTGRLTGTRTVQYSTVQYLVAYDIGCSVPGAFGLSSLLLVVASRVFFSFWFGSLPTGIV